MAHHLEGMKLLNFTNLQKTTNLHKNAKIEYMQFICINSQRNKNFKQQAQHDAQQRNKNVAPLILNAFLTATSATRRLA